MLDPDRLTMLRTWPGLGSVGWSRALVALSTSSIVKRPTVSFLRADLFDRLGSFLLTCLCDGLCATDCDDLLLRECSLG